VSWFIEPREGGGENNRRYRISEKKALKGQREERKLKWTVPFYIF
jgi:hypothetical protein